MNDKRKEPRTGINYNAFYMGFPRDSSSGRIIPCVILDISQHGIKISSTEPSSDDNIAVSFVNREKKHLIVTGRVIYCRYMHNVSPLEPYVFNIGIRFLDHQDNVTEFITTLVRFSSKIKAEKSFSLRQSQLLPDQKDTEGEIVLGGIDPNDVVWGSEKDLEISFNDLSESNTDEGLSGNSFTSGDSGDPKSLEAGFKQEEISDKGAKNKNKKDKKIEKKPFKSYKKSKRIIFFKAFYSLFLLSIIGISILFILPSSLRLQIPYINQVSLEFPMIDRLFNLPSSDKTGKGVLINDDSLTFMTKENSRGREYFIITGALDNVKSSDPIKIIGYIYDEKNNVINTSDVIAGIILSEDEFKSIEIGEMNKTLDDPLKKQKIIHDNRVPFMIVFSKPDVRIYNYTVELIP